VARSRRPFLTMLSVGLAAATLSTQSTAEATGLVAPPADAKPTIGSTFAVDGEPQRITMGPDGNLWFGVTDNSGTNDLARITPAGAITYFQLGAVNVGTLVTGPDGNLWATIDTGVAKIPTTDPTTLTTYDIPGFANAQGIAVGPDNNLWAAAGDNVYRVPLAAPTTATPFNVAGMGARQVAATADRIWVVDFNGKVHAFQTDGTFTSVDVGGNPQGIAAGPGGQVLYSNPEAGANHAARLVLGGTPEKTPLPATDPSFSVAFGADDAYWVGLFLTREMARITPAGELTTYGTFPAPYLPRYVAAGPGDSIWVSLQNPGNSGAIGLVTGLDVDKTATITVKGGKAKVKNRKAKVKLQCPADEISGPCTGKIKLKALSGKKKGLGSKAYSVVAGTTGAVKVKLSRAALDRIGPKGLKVKAVVTVQDALGNQAKVVKKIKLVR
jgi:virginiamycin B lyase